MSDRTRDVRRATRWHKVRAKGKRDYILKLALLLASFNFAFFLLIRIIWPSKSAPRDPLEHTLGYAGLMALGGLIVGLMMGEWTWGTNEKRYSKGLKGDGAVEKTDTPP